MRKIMFIGMSILMITLVFALGCQKQDEINSFEDCVNAGNPVMESYPRQCRANGVTYVEEVNDSNDSNQNNSELKFTECTDDDKNRDTVNDIYSPVCALVDNGIRCVTEPCPSVNYVTYDNNQKACAKGQAHGYYQGRCENQTLVVCGETVTGFDPEEFAKNNNGICVDVCPGNYDGFVTQIGIELCIPHYGLEEIEQWPVCGRSNDSCNCVKAYETTSNEQIEDAEYRCVPEMYAERLLFRGGQDRLDENGRQSVAIA